MRFLNLTLPSPAENLALDEALLLHADQQRQKAEEVLRIWQAERVFVVVGRSSRVEEEVERERAEQLSVPILRRVSGGASIVAAPGCLFYSVLIDLSLRPELRMLDEAHRFVTSRLLQATSRFQPELSLLGTCDLAIEGRKVSGNSMRITRDWMLYHGTLLLDMNLEWISQLLRHPPREPDYRAGRSHADFVANLPASAEEVTASLRRTWEADQAVDWLAGGDLTGDCCPLQLVPKLVAERYGQASWNFQR